MVEAHGGLARWQAVPSVRFRILSRAWANPEAFLSTETVERATGRAYLEWPTLDAASGFDGREVWSRNWSSPLPAGFFTRLSFSFLTLPFLTQNDGVRIGAPEPGRLPSDTTEYRVVRMTMDGPAGTMPGTYYRLFIHPSTFRLHGLEFDIAHPGMVRIPNQPLGPNLHVFHEWRESGGLVLPSYYVSYGFNDRTRTNSSAVHFVFDLSVDRAFDAARTRRPADGVVDSLTMAFWRR